MYKGNKRESRVHEEKWKIPHFAKEKYAMCLKICDQSIGCISDFQENLYIFKSPEMKYFKIKHTVKKNLNIKVFIFQNISIYQLSVVNKPLQA